MENGMIKELYGKICERTDTRACLIALKKEIREEGGKRALAYLLAGDYSEFALLLKDEDAFVWQVNYNSDIEKIVNTNSIIPNIS